MNHNEWLDSDGSLVVKMVHRCFAVVHAAKNDHSRVATGDPSTVLERLIIACRWILGTKDSSIRGIHDVFSINVAMSEKH